MVRASGPARAFVNDQAVSAAFLAEIGELLIEIHGQHAASALMRPSMHRRLLDQFAGNEKLLSACAEAFDVLQVSRDARACLEAEQADAVATREWLEQAVEELERLAPAAGEAAELASQRMRLMQSERVTESIGEAEAALEGADIDGALSRASRAMERICRLPGFDGSSEALPEAARLAAEAVERALIETREASSAVFGLERLIHHDTEALESAEARLFALRALARKHTTDPETLPGPAAAPARTA